MSGKKERMQRIGRIFEMQKKLVWDILEMIDEDNLIQDVAWNSLICDHKEDESENIKLFLKYYKEELKKEIKEKYLNES